MDERRREFLKASRDVLLTGAGLTFIGSIASEDLERIVFTVAKDEESLDIEDGRVDFETYLGWESILTGRYIRTIEVYDSEGNLDVRYVGSFMDRYPSRMDEIIDSNGEEFRIKHRLLGGIEIEHQLPSGETNDYLRTATFQESIDEDARERLREHYERADRLTSLIFDYLNSEKIE